MLHVDAGVPRRREVIIKPTHRRLWYEDGVLKRVLEPGRLQAAALLEPRLLPPSANQGRPRGRP